MQKNTKKFKDIKNKRKLDSRGDESKFSIDARTCTLKDISLSDDENGVKVNYVIPIYQRPYFWKEVQIEKFLSDIFSSFWGYDKKSSPEPMFVGTMQLSAPKDGKSGQDIIDGQQRLTTFLILLKQLKIKYPKNAELRETEMSWLETKVNNGEQNKFLSEYLHGKPTNDETIESQNPYIRNAGIVQGFLMEELTDEDNNARDFNVDNFVNHILSNIYFVVIETNAVFSKTLQIFDAINTTGMDLNGGDIFKIRMSEYLTDKKGFGESAFVEVSRLYAKIDNQNKELNLNISITQVLGTYKYFIISKYNLPRELYKLATSTFFERLFDTIFNINRWKHFAKAKEVELDLADIEQLIDSRYYWEKIKYPTVEDACAMHFIWTSRYSKYWNLVFIFLFRFRVDPSVENKLFLFVRQLSKLYIIYSIRFKRAINEMDTFTYNLIDTINSRTENDAIHFINKKIADREKHNPGRYNLDRLIANNLTENARRKNMICRLAAMLEEGYKLPYAKTDVVRNLFKSDIDIEHIQSFNDADREERENIRNEWGAELHSLGNLMVLERDMNRSILNKSYDSKLTRYGKSKYAIVRNHAKDFRSWDLSHSKARKEMQKEKLYEYLFSS